MRNLKNYTRRDFLKRLAFNNDGENFTEDTLVCVFLRGGADTLNIFVPYGLDEYYKLRPNIAIKPPGASAEKDRGLKLDDFYALHPLMAPLLPLYKSGRMAIVQAVGTDNTSGSHFSCQDQIEHGESCHKNLSGGWLGRYLASRAVEKQTPLSAVAVGTTLPEALRGAPAASVIKSLDDLQLKVPNGNTQAIANALGQMYSAEIGLLAGPGQVTLQLLARVEKMQVKSKAAANGATYPDSDFAQGLEQIARLIKAKVGLEIACIDIGGWDTHFLQGAANGLQATNIAQLANGLAAFNNDLGSLGKNVTTLVITEFGRRSYENSSLGTDHGRGFAVMAIGDKICGGKIHGNLPTLRSESQDILGPSGLQIEFDYRSVITEILKYALGNHRTDLIFPDFIPQKVGLLSTLPQQLLQEVPHPSGVGS